MRKEDPRSPGVMAPYCSWSQAQGTEQSLSCHLPKGCTATWHQWKCSQTHVHKSKHSAVLRLKLNGFKICERAREPFWAPFKVWYYLNIFDCLSIYSLEQASSLCTRILAVGAEGGSWNCIEDIFSHLIQRPQRTESS